MSMSGVFGSREREKERERERDGKGKTSYFNKKGVRFQVYLFY